MEIGLFKDKAKSLGYSDSEIEAFLANPELHAPQNTYKEAPGTTGSTETVVTDEETPPVVTTPVDNTVIATLPTGKTVETFNPNTLLMETKRAEIPITADTAKTTQPAIQEINNMFNTPVSGSSASVNPTATPSSESFFRTTAYAAEPTPTPQQPIEGVKDAVQPSPTPSVKRVIPTGTKIYNNYGAKSQTLWSNGGGKHWGTDYAFEAGTPLSVPEGDWEVSYAWNNAKQNGYLGNKENSGYGNSVILKNRQTGETIRYSHLSDIPVKPGQIVKQGDTVAITGNTGNTNAPHVDVEYRDASGNWSDIRKSPYKKYF